MVGKRPKQKRLLTNKIYRQFHVKSDNTKITRIGQQITKNTLKCVVGNMQQKAIYRAVYNNLLHLAKKLFHPIQFFTDWK